LNEIMCNVKQAYQKCSNKSRGQLLYHQLLHGTWT